MASPRPRSMGMALSRAEQGKSEASHLGQCLTLSPVTAHGCLVALATPT